MGEYVNTTIEMVVFCIPALLLRHLDPCQKFMSQLDTCTAGSHTNVSPKQADRLYYLLNCENESTEAGNQLQIWGRRLKTDLILIKVKLTSSKCVNTKTLPKRAKNKAQEEAFNGLQNLAVATNSEPKQNMTVNSV